MLSLSILNVITFALIANAAPAPVPNANFGSGLIPNVISNAIEQLNLDIEISDNKKDKILNDSFEESGYPSIFKKNPALFKLHSDIVNIESISDNELAVSNYLQSYLRSLGLGLELTIDETGKNIYASGSESGNSKVLLTSHIDTVPPYINYSINELDDGDVEIHGRGSCDAKGSVAAQIIAAKELLEDNIITADDLSLLFVFGEEVGGKGMRSANKYFNENNINWEAVIFGEPTENSLAIGHKGIYMSNIEVIGLASHSGYPELGIDADKILIEIMHELENYPWPTSKLLNLTTINIGLMHGGTAGNVVSPYATCSILMRTAVDADEIHPIVKRIVDKYRPSAKEIIFNVEVEDDPVSLDYDVEGFDTIIASYATDIPKLDHKGFKRYLYGPGSILVAHGDNEFVTAKSLLKAVDDYKKLVLNALGRL